MVWGGGKNTCKHESLNFQLQCSYCLVLFDSVSCLSVLAHCTMLYLLPVKQTCCILVRTGSLQWPTQRPEKTMHFKWLKTLTMLSKLKIDFNNRLLWFHGKPDHPFWWTQSTCFVQHSRAIFFRYALKSNLWGTPGLKYVLQRWCKKPCQLC